MTENNSVKEGIMKLEKYLADLKFSDPGTVEAGGSKGLFQRVFKIDSFKVWI